MPHEPTVPEGDTASDIEVAVVDDNRVSREEHARLLNAEPGVTVVSAEATLSVSMLAEKQPDVVLVEAGETEVAALRAAVTTRRVLPEASVIITDLVPQNEDIADFVKAGVAGFVLKEATSDDIVDTVKTVADGSHVLPDELTSPLFVQIAAEGVNLDGDAGRKLRGDIAASLTQREQQVVELIGEGMANKEIGARLSISTATVKTHVARIMEKTGLRTRVLLATRATSGSGA